MGWRSLGQLEGSLPQNLPVSSHTTFSTPSLPRPLPHTAGLCPRATALGLCEIPPAQAPVQPPGLHTGPGAQPAQAASAGASSTGRDRLLVCLGLSCRAEPESEEKAHLLPPLPQGLFLQRERAVTEIQDKTNTPGLPPPTTVTVCYTERLGANPLKNLACAGTPCLHSQESRTAAGHFHSTAFT